MLESTKTAVATNVLVRNLNVFIILLLVELVSLVI